MTRSIEAKLMLFGCEDCLTVDRIGLNRDQTDGLPPSPALRGVAIVAPLTRYGTACAQFNIAPSVKGRGFRRGYA